MVEAIEADLYSYRRPVEEDHDLDISAAKGCGVGKGEEIYFSVVLRDMNHRRTWEGSLIGAVEIWRGRCPLAVECARVHCQDGRTALYRCQSDPLWECREVGRVYMFIVSVFCSYGCSACPAKVRVLASKYRR